mgnify:CR=1 FL=1
MRINRLESSADIDLNVCVYKYFKRVGENGLSAVAIVRLLVCCASYGHCLSPMILGITVTVGYAVIRTEVRLCSSSPAH